MLLEPFLRIGGYMAGGVKSGRIRERKTMKCDKEKLTAKLAAIANSFAARTWTKIAANTRVVVLATSPAMPEATKLTLALAPLALNTAKMLRADCSDVSTFVGKRWTWKIKAIS